MSCIALFLAGLDLTNYKGSGAPLLPAMRLTGTSAGTLYRAVLLEALLAATIVAIGIACGPAALTVSTMAPADRRASSGPGLFRHHGGRPGRLAAGHHCLATATEPRTRTEKVRFAWPRSPLAIRGGRYQGQEGGPATATAAVTGVALPLKTCSQRPRASRFGRLVSPLASPDSRGGWMSGRAMAR
jgi:hypothetical protein